MKTHEITSKLCTKCEAWPQQISSRCWRCWVYRRALERKFVGKLWYEPRKRDFTARLIARHEAISQGFKVPTALSLAKMFTGIKPSTLVKVTTLIEAADAAARRKHGTAGSAGAGVV